MKIWKNKSNQVGEIKILQSSKYIHGLFHNCPGGVASEGDS